jgi:Holliday junction DNA helicase RuvA
MIGKLKGYIDSIQEDRMIIDVCGVGYLVFISSKTGAFLKQFPKSEQVSLTIDTLVKEDAIELYGFVSEIEKIWFHELTKVQGVGNKVGLKILSFFTIDELVRALISSDVKSFTKIAGIGPKLAARIVQELKESPKKLGLATNYGSNFIDEKDPNINHHLLDDAISALENLGYKKSDIYKIALGLINQNNDITLENLITSCLRELSKNKF